MIEINFENRTMKGSCKKSQFKEQMRKLKWMNTSQKKQEKEKAKEQ